MAESDQITRHEREIGELRGKLDALATKEFVRKLVQDQTQELNTKFDGISADLRALNAKQHRITGAADFLKSALPISISAITLIVLVLSLILTRG